MESFWAGLMLPWQYEFARHALLAGLGAGVLCPVIGSILVVQRMALLGDVIAHATLPGLALAYWLRWETLIGAVGSGVLAVMAVAALRTQTEVRVDGAMALIFSSFFAAGILLTARLRIPINLEDLLFGNILNVSAADVGRTAIATLVLLVLVKVFYKEILFYTFDRQGAAAAGLPVRVLHLAVTVAAALAITLSVRTMGVALAIALMVGPALTAGCFGRELHHLMVGGAGLGMLAAGGGLYLSFYVNLPTGPVIAHLAAGMFPGGLLVRNVWNGWQR
ncbi:MAG: metal ABC transporter permease [Pseudanabaenaceae cyanobacterium]